MSALSLGLSPSGVRSYVSLTHALAALSEAGTPSPCAGKAADFTANLCTHCPVQKLCADHGTRHEEAPEWKQPKGEK